MQPIPRNAIALALVAFSTLAAAQAPLLHYHFNPNSTATPGFTDNAGTLMPGLSPMIGHTITGTSANGTKCLRGAGGTTSEVTTPMTLTSVNGSWSVGFCIDDSANPGGFQYIFSEDVSNGFRAFTNGAAGAGNIRLAGGGCPTVDIPGGAGDGGWVHVAWVHNSVNNTLAAYKDGVLVSTSSAPSVNLASGNTLRIGRNQAACLLNGTLVEDFRFYGYALTAAEVTGWAQSGLDGSARFGKVMMTELCWTVPRAFELTNFGQASVSLTDWKIKWRNFAANFVSDPINLSIAPNESIVIVDNPIADPMPPGTQVVDRFPAPISQFSGGFTVALLDAIGTVVDEAMVDTANVTTSVPSAGGIFRGQAANGVGIGGAERIWGLDSDSEADWTVASVRTLGRENTSDGVRGSDPLPVPVVRINEIDDVPDLIELYNPGALVNLSGWFFWISPGNGINPTIVTIPDGTPLLPLSYVVFGDDAAPPPELAAGIPYVQTSSIPFTVLEYECALYDRNGRLIDLVRATMPGSQLVHNLPRAPSQWSDFIGVAMRLPNGGAQAIGRNLTSSDTNSGADFFPIFTRTMGSSNPTAAIAGSAGWGSALDVRLNETSLGQGFAAILNAGPASAGLQYNFILGLGHANGAGSFFGLGPDAIANLPTFYHVPPFWGVLGPSGSARIEFPAGSLPPGLDADFIFFLQDGADQLVKRTLVLEFDT